MKRFLAMILTLAMVMSMLPVGALAAEEETAVSNVVYGTYNDSGEWVANDAITDGKLTTDGVAVAKVATPTGNPNEYSVTLTVETSTTTTTSAVGAATVLVIDVSGSMDFCAECGGGNNGMLGGDYHNEGCTHYSEDWRDNAVSAAQSRMYAARVAAINFMKSYGGITDSDVTSNNSTVSTENTAAMGRYVSVVKFSDDGSVAQDWIDVSTVDGYKAAKRSVLNLSAGGGTNLDDGLYHADTQLDASAISSVSNDQKYVVALTDGIPTYRRNGGNGSDGSEANNTAAANTATALKETAKLYTVCFGVANENCYSDGPTVGNFLKNSIATSADYAFNADNTSQLNAAFSEITESITEGISAGMVSDPMGDAVESFTVSGENISQDAAGFTWELKADDAEQTTEGSTTKYKWTLTYTVKMDAAAADYDFDGDIPINKKTTLTVGETVVQFPVPAVNVVCDDTITIDVVGGEKTYDGSPLNATYTSNIPEGFTLDAVLSNGTITDAGTVTAGVTSYTIMDAEGNDVTDKFVNVNAADTADLTVTKRSVVLASESATQEYNGKALTRPNVALSGDGWAEGEGATVKATGSQTTPGSCANTIVYELNEGTNKNNYEITENVGTLTVTNRAAKYEIDVVAKSNQVTYNGAEHTISGIEKLTFEVEGNTYTVEGLSASGSGTDAGTYTNEITGTAVVKDADGNDVTAQFIVNQTNGTLTIDKRQVTLTSATAEKEYDGTALTNDKITVGGDGWANGEGATYDVTGTITQVGNKPNNFEYTPDDNTNENNYTITKQVGTLTITNRTAKYEVSVTAKSGEYRYDGTEKIVTDFETLEVTAENGLKYTVSGLTAEGKRTDAGETTVTVSGEPTVTDAAGNDVTDQFTVKAIPGILKINKRTVVMESASDEKEYDGEPLTNSEVTVSGDGWADNEGATYEVTGTRTLVGTAENSFTYTLNEGTKAGNYSISTAEGSLTVKSRTAKYEITVEANSGEEKYDGAEKTVSGFKTLTFEVKGNTYTVEGLTAEGKRTNAGETAVVISGTPVVKDAEGNVVTDEFAVSTVNGKLVITKRAVTLTSADDSKEYDGTPLTNDTVTVGGDGFANDEGATYTVTGSQTLKGESKNAFTYALNADTKAENYDITKVEGTLTVTNRSAKYEITVEASSDTKLYDGKAMTVEGFTEPLEYTFTTEEGKTATFTVENLTASVTGTDAGTYTNEITYIDETIGRPVVKDADGNDVTEQFIVKTVDGTLTINKRTVVMKSATVEKDYDGTPLENDFINDFEEGNGFIDGEGATYTVTGSQLLVGSSENKFTYELNEGTKADNYNISTIYGTLTVTKREAPYKITVVANSGGEMYNGAAQTVEGFETLTFTTEDGNTYTVSGLTASTTETDAGEYAVNVVGTPVVKDAAGNDVSDQFSVSTENGTLTITKRSVTLTSATAQKTYDGKVLTNDTVTVSGDGFVEGEGASYNVTGSQLLVGSSENYFTYTLSENTKDGNYEIKTVNGTLTVADRDEPFVITVEANSGEFDYDSTEKTVSGFKTLTFYVNENEYTVEGLTAEAAETNAGTYAVEVTGTPVVKDAQGNAVTDQFDVELIDGTLIINRATVTVTVDENQRKVIGNEDPELTATITGLAEGDEESLISYTLTREAGENVGTYDITASGEDVQGNYNVIYVNGTFRITAGELTLNNKDHMRYMQGYPDGTFMPEKNMTRAEVAVMFCRLLNNSMSIDSDAQSPFSDVKEGDWYYEEVCFMAENGILKGYPDGTFGPWEPITRAEFATICTRFDVARQTEATVLANEFPDVTKRDWFYDYVMTAAGNGWVGGFPDGNFKPNDFITRSQVVTVVNRVLERIADKDYINNAVINGAEDFRTYIDVAGNWAYYDIYEASIAHDYHKDETEETVVETWERHWMELYTVAFHISGTTPDVASVFDETYKVGQKVDLPTAEDVAEMHNTVFLGWALTENATTPVDEYIVDADDSFVSENGVDHQIIHLYAVWG